MDIDALDLSEPGVADAVLRLQRAAYRVEADLIGSEAIPPLHESLGELVRAPVEWLGIWNNGELVAAVAYSVSGATVDIDRLVVHPDRMRRGLGSALLQALPANTRLTVSTGTRNEPAHRFYRTHGFEPVGETEPVPGLHVTHFARAAHGA
ncbi:MAG: GNAT family N-acetyltransferase [Acidimicrobiia bacterium]|nr:GNAT family N-acetyltransferase [Acidimicrobiia bacterium]